MREDEALPVAAERILAAHRVDLDAAARFAGLEQQMHLGIVPQRLIMPHALDRLRDRLKIDDAARVELRMQAEARFNQLLQNFLLHLPHQLHADLPRPRVPAQMQLRVLLFEHAQAP